MAEPTDDASRRAARLRRTLVDDVWRAGAFFMPLIVVGATLRDIRFHGLSWSTVVTAGLCLTYLLAFGFRRRFPADLAAFLPVGFLMAIAVLSTYRNGLQANGPPLLIVVNALVALVFSRRLAQITFGITGVVMITAAVGFISHRLPARLAADYATSPQSWFMSCAAVLAAAWLMLRGVAPYRESLQRLTDRIAAQRDEIAALANRDHLTGLPTAQLARDRLNVACRRAARSGEQVAVLFIDLDHFKAVNDGFGHQAGDHVLRTVAGRLTDALRKADTAARRGGDEFLVFLDGGIDAVSARRLADKLVAAIGAPIPYENVTLRVGASIGVALFPGDGETPDDLMRHADMAMYGAKASGRNRVVLRPAP